MPFVALAVLILGIWVAILKFYTAKNYLGQNSPCYTANHAIEQPGTAETITVISYNISYGRNIEQALSEITDPKFQKAVDILLLQEMEELGTDRMARELRMNYVYFPAAVEPTWRRNFGNAILTRWPIVESQKIILPHKSLSNRMIRIATRARIRIPDVEILAYSIHTEPVFTLPSYKRHQCTRVLSDILPEDNFVIIGGDFNLFSRNAVAGIEKDYAYAGFVRASTGSGDTFARFGINMPPDHIFTRGFVVTGSGKLAQAKASDHLPIWVNIKPQYAQPTSKFIG